MHDCGNNISDHVLTALLPRLRVEWEKGAETVVLPPFDTPPAIMPTTAICCLLPYRDIPYSGTDVRIDGVMHHVAPGDCLVVPEGCRCRYFRENDAVHRSVWCHLRCSLEPGLPLLDFFDVPAVIRGAAAARCRRLIGKLNRGHRGRLITRAWEMTSPRRSGGLAEKLEDRAWALLLLQEILRLAAPKETLLPAIGGFHELEGAMQWIQLHKFEKINLDTLAECCHCSRSSFEKKFRRSFGISPGKYLLNLRLSAAELMLRDTDDSCARIAEACGFANQFIFSRLFSQRYGIPPRDYRNRKIFS